MPSSGDDDKISETTDHAEGDRNAWARTLDDMTAMAEEREENGWRTVVIPAGHTAPEPPDAGANDRYGLVYVVPGNKAGPFREVYEVGQFPRYEVYRGATETQVFLVTELTDPGTETAIYVAGNYRRRDARALLRVARRRGKMYTHLQKLDQTHLGSFEHDDYQKFFPERDVSALDAADDRS